MKKLIFTALLAICVGAVAQTTGKLLKVIKNDDTEVTYRLADLEDVSGIVFLEVEVPFDTTSVDTIPTDTLPIESHSGYVALGLPSGTKWAACNVGASLPADKGDIFAWGETKPHPDGVYTWDNYKYSRGDYFLTKYVSNVSNPIMNGVPDNKGVLERSDDAASINNHDPFYKDCHMPTDAQIKELISNCKWEWTTRVDSDGNEVEGYLVISLVNRNAIFLPITDKSSYVGYCYWSSHIGRLGNESGFCLYISPNRIGVDDVSRFNGLPVRGVLDSKK